MIRRFWKHWEGFVVVMGAFFIAFAVFADVKDNCVKLEDYNAAKIAAAEKGTPAPKVCDTRDLIVKFDIFPPKKS